MPQRPPPCPKPATRPGEDRCLGAPQGDDLGEDGSTVGMVHQLTITGQVREGLGVGGDGVAGQLLDQGTPDVAVRMAACKAAKRGISGPQGVNEFRHDRLEVGEVEEEPCEIDFLAIEGGGGIAERGEAIVHFTPFAAGPFAARATSLKSLWGSPRASAP